MSPEKKLTIDDVKHHAEEVRDLAVSEVDDFFHERGTQAAIIGAVAILMAMSVAFYLGARMSCGIPEQ